MGRKIMNIITTFLLILMVAVVIFVFVTRLSGSSPSIFGYHIFRVSSGSMEPTLAIGDIILVKETPVEEIHKDDIITYDVLDGSLKGQTITHQVIEEPYQDEGKWYLQTQGIAAGAAKDPMITYDQVEGKYVRTLPLFNKLYSFFLSPYGLIVFVGVIVLLFGYEMISLLLSYRSASEHGDDYYEPKPKKKRKKRKH